MEQLYLEQLVVKPMPKKQEKIMVKVKIVDKTKEMHINRQMILNRLNNKNLLQVRKQVPISDNQIITIKKPKKINETIKIEVEEEKVEEEEVEEEKEEKVVEEDVEEKVEEDKVEEEKVEEDKVEQDKVEEEKVEEKEEEQVKEKVKKQPKAKGKNVISILPRKYEINQEIQNVKLGKHTVEERLPKPEKIIIKTSPYYMNNRRMFIQKLREMFKDYSKK